MLGNSAQNVEILQPSPASGLAANAGLSVLTGPLEAEAGWELGAGSREAREIRMFNHWAAGLRSGLLPEDCGVATPKRGEKRGADFGSLQGSFDFWVRGLRA